MHLLAPTDGDAADRSSSPCPSAVRPLARPSASIRRGGSRPRQSPSQKTRCPPHPAGTGHPGPALTVGFLTLFVAILTQHRADAGISEGVKRAMETNATHLSPITVSWVEQRGCEGSREEVRARIREENNRFFEPSYFAFRHDAAKWYASNRSNSWAKDLGSMNSHAEWSFDGENLYNGTGMDRKGLPILSIEPIVNLREGMRGATYVDPAYFLNAGFRFPVAPEEFGQNPKPLVLYEIAGGAREGTSREVDLEGTRCLLVELIMAGNDRHLFFLDPAIEYTVRRREHRTAEGNLSLVVENRDFKALKSGLRLPRSSRVEYYEWNGQRSAKPLFWIDFNATELHDDPIPIDRFRLDYSSRPGSMVKVTGQDKAQSSVQRNGRFYQVPARREHLEAAVRHAEGDGTHPYAIGRTTIAVAVALVPPTTAILWFALRRRNRSR
jgi:hypothetical protein